MEWAALVAWILTAGGGFLMLAIWISRGGMKQREPGRIRPPLILGHFALAATGLVIWFVHVLVDSDTLAWIAFAALLVVAALGFTMFVIWGGQRRAGPATADAATVARGPSEPAEQRFPVPIVALHGVAAVTTLALVLLAALGVGTS